ncbi:MAG TPA: response regulator [Blastocatellia bacterium]|nr:response regulator [Blastocatellia bacterium]
MGSSNDQYQTNQLPDYESIKDESDDAGPWKGKLVLVVDDLAENIAVVSLDLQYRGYRVVTAGDGEEAIKIALVSKPDVILMDIGMPDVDGFEATRRIRNSPELGYIPIIALTAFSTDGFKRAAANAGVDGYMTKPVDFARLHKLILHVLRLD